MRHPLAFLALAVLVVGCASTGAPNPNAAVDYGDYTSQTLTTNAWNALTDEQYELAIRYTEKCIELYGEKAREMQAGLDETPHFKRVHDYWALNDVGTSYFIQGEALAKLGRTEEALASFEVVKSEFTYAQTWDPKGWFWKPSDAAYSRIQRYGGDF